MKPLTLRPAFKDYLWGGTKLNDYCRKHSGLARTAESWEVSVHPDGLSVIDGGEHDGQTLADYIAADPSVLGTARRSDELPVLIKLIDAADDLSIQVHPNDEQARAWEGQNGKTELWYVMQAETDAHIVYGVKEDTTPEVLAEAIRTNTVMALLDSVPSHRGDSFFVKAGTVHAIGRGNLIAEIQQSSNVTYRLYDYDRRDKHGEPRPLHIEKGVKAAVLKRQPPYDTPRCDDGTRLLGRCEYFEVRELAVNGEAERCCTSASFQCLITVQGELAADGDPLAVGDVRFLPAGLGAYTLRGNGTVLLVTLPQV